MQKTILPILLFLMICLTGKTFAAEQTFFYLTDPAGTPLAMTNASGAVVWKADYKPFGEENTVTASASNDRRFVGKEKDEETGLSYFGARYENAKIGRFIAPDPVRAVDPKSSQTNEKLLLNPQRLNTYAYGLNNPYRYVDPDGNIPLDTIWDIGNVIYDIATGDMASLTADSAAMLIPYVPAGITKVAKGVDNAIEAGKIGRHGKQARLRELANDDKAASSTRGWINQEINSIERGQRSSIRNPPGKDLAHERGREASKGYGYEHSNLQDRDLHKTQHKYDNFGRKNSERKP